MIKIQYRNLPLSNEYSIFTFAPLISSPQEVKRNQKIYEYKGVYEKNYTLRNRLCLLFRAVIQLPNLKAFKEDWNAFWLGKRLVAVYQPKLQSPATSSFLPSSEKPLNPLSYGNKFSGLHELDEILKKHFLQGVSIPEYRGLSHAEIEKHLKFHAPQIFARWENLAKASQSAASLVDFMKDPDIQKQLEELRSDIKKALVTQFSFSSPLIEWLSSLHQQKRLLMVRSSSVEDGQNLTNAGGNYSQAYVPADPPSVQAACANVVVSYFSDTSLRNQIVAGINPFQNRLQLSVLLQELIRETGGIIPVSLVLFTHEPLYSDSQFKVMKISSSYGHGEGVVNNRGIITETLHVVSSRASPGRILEIYYAPSKPERLAPTKENLLQSTPNPSELIDRPTLSPKLIHRLYDFSKVVETVMQKPMDLEICIQNDHIYVVQMRPIVRPPQTPTYLSAPADQQNPIIKTFRTEILVPGKLQAMKLKSKKQILFCQTLKEAEGLFKKEKHRCVVVTTPEPSNSHPVINFSCMGIPCFYTQENLENSLQNLNSSQSIALCSQSGRFCIWDESVASSQSGIQKGYFSHPAPLNTLSQEGLILSSDPTDSQKMEETLFQLKIAQTQEVYLKTLQQLQVTPLWNHLQQKLSEFENNPSINALQETEKRLNLLQRLSKAVQQAFAEIQNSFEATHLEKLFHIKRLYVLFLGERKDSVCLLHAPSLIKGIEKILCYEKQFSFPPRFTRYLLLREKLVISSHREKWDEFLTQLENQKLNDSQTRQFHQLMQMIQDYQLMPVWFYTIFLSLWNSEKKISKLLEFLLQDLSQDQAILSFLNMHFHALGKLSAAPFEHPQNIGPEWGALEKLMKELSSPDFLKALSGSKLVQITALEVMKKFVDLFDESIKMLKKSDRFSDQDKLKYMNLILQENFMVLAAWLIKTPLKNQVHPHVEGNDIIALNRYIKWIAKSWENIHLSDPQNLLPSPDFSVLAACLGSSAFVNRHPPKTLEDIFTLLHQNQLFFIGYFYNLNISDSILQQMDLPFIIQMTHKKLTHHPSFKKLEKVGVEITDSSFMLKLNQKLNNHSMSIDLEWNSLRGAIVHAKFFGERGESRWRTISEILEIFNTSNIVKIQSLSPYTQQEVQFGLIIEAEQIDSMIEILSHFLKIADGNRDFQEKIMNFCQKHKNARSIAKTVFDRCDKNRLDFDLYSISFIFWAFDNDDFVLEFLKKIEIEYGESNQENVLNKEIDHLCTILSSLLFRNNSKHVKFLNELLKKIIEKYLNKNIEFKKLFKLIFLNHDFFLDGEDFSSKIKSKINSQKTKENYKLSNKLDKQINKILDLASYDVYGENFFKLAELYILEFHSKDITHLDPSDLSILKNVLKKLFNKGYCLGIDENWVQKIEKGELLEALRNARKKFSKSET